MRVADYGTAELAGGDLTTAEKAMEAASDSAITAAWKLTETPIKTIAGAAALMRYLSQFTVAEASLMYTDEQGRNFLMCCTLTLRGRSSD